jgi:hypothetical protein
MNEKIISALQKYQPKSIFLYGSQGRGDNNASSDYEVTVLFDDNNYTPRSVIHSEIQLPLVRIYPYRIGEFKDETFATTFQKNIFMRELAECGRTIYGEKIVEALSRPRITTLDLIQRIRFDLGYALAAVLSHRSGDGPTALEEFSKSCLFGMRCLIILEAKKFAGNYDEIYTVGKKLLTDKHQKVLDEARQVRKGKSQISADIIFENIGLLLHIEERIVDRFKKYGIEELC